MQKALLAISVIILALLTGCAARSSAIVSSPTAQNPGSQAKAATSDAPAQIAAPGDIQAFQPATPEAGSPSPVIVTKPSAPAQETFVAASIEVYEVAYAISAAAVYPVPDPAATELGQVRAGSKVVVTRALGDWYEIVYLDAPGSHAWIRNDIVTLDAVTPSPIVTAAAPASTAIPSVPAPKVTSGKAAEKQTAASKVSGLSGALVLQESNGGAIYIYDLASKSLRRLTAGLDPALSPDGRMVAFTRLAGEHGLYLINADGTNERRIYGDSRDLRTPSWSPDGRYILFSRVNGEDTCRQVGPRCVPDRPGLENFPLVIMDKRGLSRVNPDGGDFRDIPTMETAISPDWNAAGVAYAVAEGLQITADQTDAASRSLLNARNYSAQDPNWQPGGGRIVFQKKEGTHWEIYSVNPDGSGLQPLTRPVSVLVDELPQNVSPAWSPDGRSIAYLSNREASGSAGKWRIWVMDADGGNQRPLAPESLGQIEFRYDNSADQMIDWS